MVWLPRRKWCNTANFFVLLFFFKLKINIFFKTFTIKALVQLNIVVLISGHDHIQYKYFHLTLHDTLYHIWILKHKILYLYNYLFNLKEHLLCLMSFILKWFFFVLFFYVTGLWCWLCPLWCCLWPSFGIHNFCAYLETK